MLELVYGLCVCVGAVERHDETKPQQKRDPWKLSPSNCRWKIPLTEEKKPSNRDRNRYLAQCHFTEMSLQFSKFIPHEGHLKGT